MQSQMAFQELLKAEKNKGLAFQYIFLVTLCEVMLYAQKDMEKTFRLERKWRIKKGKWKAKTKHKILESVFQRIFLVLLPCQKYDVSISIVLRPSNTASPYCWNQNTKKKKKILSLWFCMIKKSTLGRGRWRINDADPDSWLNKPGRTSSAKLLKFWREGKWRKL